MPFCPNCREEYREGFTKCADCGCDLVDVLGPEMPKPEVEEDPYVYLQSIQDGPLGESSLAILRAYDIPYMMDYGEFGLISGLYGGKSLTGLNIYVPRSCEAEARRLLSRESTDYIELNRLSALSFEFSELIWEDRFDVCNIYNFYAVNTGFVPQDEPVSLEWVCERFLTEESADLAFAVRDGERLIGLVTVAPKEDGMDEGVGQVLVLAWPECWAGDLICAGLQKAESLARESGFETLFMQIPAIEKEWISWCTSQEYVEMEEQRSVLEKRGREYQLLYFEKILESDFGI